jgi:hypothetical protein
MSLADFASPLSSVKVSVHVLLSLKLTTLNKTKKGKDSVKLVIMKVAISIND